VPPDRVPQGLPARFVETVPGSMVKFKMCPVAIAEANGRTHTLWFAETETTWDAYDVFYLRLDEQAAGADPAAAGREGPDAITRPTLPYHPPDRGWGHGGYPALAVTYHAAVKYCEWLSNATGRRYRLPTESEFDQAFWGRLNRSQSLSADALWWHNGNAGRTTRAVASLRPTDDGLYDLVGNVAEWSVGKDGKPGVWGGSFMDDADRLAVPVVQKPTREWQANDPSFPKSKWWLGDAPFVGFRVVCEEGPK
jgi:hypothetical protein